MFAQSEGGCVCVCPVDDCNSELDNKHIDYNVYMYVYISI